MWNKNLNFKIKTVISMKIGKRGVLNGSSKFCYLGKHASIKNHDFSRLFPQIVKIHDLFIRTQVSDSDSGLFRFIHHCGHPEN